LEIQNSGDVAMNQEISRMSFKDAREAALRQFHRRYIAYLLQENNGNVSQAAEKAGIQRQYLHRLIKETGIKTDHFK
jgi:DNA-binding NtrC family response regulator